MARSLKSVIFVLLIATLCHGQSTSVTLTTSDGDSQVWFGGSWSAQLTSPIGIPCCRYVISGTSTIVPNQQQSGALDPVTGTATMTLTPNTSIAPAGTQWTFQICPLATSPCFTQSITISGATQTVALTPPAIRVSLRNPQFVVAVYQDIEAVNGALGSIYFNLTTNTVRFCSALSGGNCTFTNVGAPPGTTGQFVFYTSSTSIGPDPNIDDGLTTPGTITATETVATPQLTLTGSGGLLVTSAGSVLPALGGSNGGYGVFTGGLPQLNVANAWFYTPYVTVNGTALTENKVNFNNTTPAAPTNGINIQCQVDVNGNLSCAMVGDGNAAHAFCGNGTFASCVASGSTPLSGITAAGGANTIANGNNPQVWNWAQTTASQTAFTFGETSAATGAGDVEVGIALAAGSTALPLSVSNSLTGSQALATVSITPTWNTTGVPQGALVVNPTNTASGAGSIIASFQLSGAHEVDIDKAGDLLVNTAIGGIANTTNLNICGGNGANQCGPPNINSQAGGLLLQGQDTSNNGTGAKGGFNILRAGMLTNAAPSGSALMGTLQNVVGALKGTAIAAVGDVVCTTTTAFTVTDCASSAANIVGIASNTANPIGVVLYGTVPVILDNTAVIGDIVCMSTTVAAKAHDNGTTACALGTSIGVVLATTGSIQGASGASTASTTLSTSLPLVALHIAQ